MNIAPHGSSVERLRAIQGLGMAVLGRADALVELLFPIIWVGRVHIVQVVGIGVAPTSFNAHNEGPAVLFGIGDGLDSKSQGYSGLQVAVGTRAIFRV